MVPTPDYTPFFTTTTPVFLLDTKIIPCAGHLRCGLPVLPKTESKPLSLDCPGASDGVAALLPLASAFVPTPAGSVRQQQQARFSISRL